MTEQTTPTPGVSQDADTLTRLGNFFAQSEDPAPEEERKPTEAAPEPQAAEQPAGQATEELTPDDLEVEQKPAEQPAVDAFEIVHAGQQHTLSREETIKYAQQGFDYTQKTQKLAEQDRQVTSQLRALAEVQQVQPHLMQERAQVAAIEQQLAQYQNFNWVKLAQDDAQSYPVIRAQYDVLVQAHQHARAAYDQKEGAVRQYIDRVRQERVQSEYARLPDLLPDWKDAAKRQAGETELVKHFETTYGVPAQELAQFLNGSALAMAVAEKARRYDQLLKSKASKDKQLRTVPPVTRPGAAQSQDSARADKTKDLTNRLRKTGDVKDAAALLLNRWK